MRHPQKYLRFFTVITSLTFVCVAITSPQTLVYISPFLLFLSVVVIGIPHGAIDHVVASEVYGIKNSLAGQLKFYGLYLIVMLLVGLLWFALPMAGLLFFLILSAYHFGQADVLDFTDKDGFWAQTLFVSRGLLIIGLILFAHTDIAFPIIATAIQQPDSYLSPLIPFASQIVVALILQQVLLLVLFHRFFGFTSDNYIPYTDTALITVLFLVMNPLASFAIYFALWHSAGHVREMRHYLTLKGKQMSLLGFYKEALPFTAISFFGLFLLYELFSAWNNTEFLVPLLFILISVLTLPHMIVADRMFRHLKRAD